MFAAWPKANSGEFDPATAHRIIYKLRELTGRGRDGRNDAAWRVDVRAGAGVACVPKPMVTTEISERHRHRYEFNREYEAVLTGGGLAADWNYPGREPTWK